MDLADSLAASYSRSQSSALALDAPRTPAMDAARPARALPTKEMRAPERWSAKTPSYQRPSGLLRKSKQLVQPYARPEALTVAPRAQNAQSWCRRLRASLRAIRVGTGRLRRDSRQSVGSVWAWQRISPGGHFPQTRVLTGETATI